MHICTVHIYPHTEVLYWICKFTTICCFGSFAYLLYGVKYNDDIQKKEEQL